MNLGFLKRLISGTSPKCLEHPLFGTALLVDTKSGPYWEAETVLWGRPFTVIIETHDNQEPTSAQVDFYRRFTDTPEVAFAFASRLLIEKCEKWTGHPFPSQWTVAFEFVGLSIPHDGDPQNDWDLSFNCLLDRAGHQFTCDVKKGNPSYVTVDG